LDAAFPGRFSFHGQIESQINHIETVEPSNIAAIKGERDRHNSPPLI
jgi:hypothetical protein